MKTLLVFDPRIAGASGDMVIASLVDLGAPPKILEKLCNTIVEVVPSVKSASVRVEKVRRLGIPATRVVYEPEEEHEHARDAIEVRRWIERVCDALGLEHTYRSLALRVFDTLVEAEARVHGEDPSHVHLHEVAASDTVFDIVGTVLLLKELGVDLSSIYTLPPAVGSGYIRMAHGVFPAPAPAVVEIAKMKSIPIRQIPVDAELLTPTGIAILATIARVVDVLPPMRIRSVGYGAGAADLKSVPNVLRVLLGDGAGIDLEPIVVLETSVDDVDAEVLSYVTEKLFDEGALDVQVYTSYGKKGRVFYNIRVLAKLGSEEGLARILMKELGTLGVRVHRVERFVAERQIVPIEVEIFGIKKVVRVKIARVDGDIVRVKPEYEDVKAIARELGKPIRDIYREIMKRITEALHR